MDCKVFKSTGKINANDLNSKLTSLNFYTQGKKDVSIFHFNKIKDNIFHIVFNIDEEIYTGSKYVKNISKLPINMYINTFLILDSNMLCIENVYSQYCDLIIKSIFDITGITFIKYEFSQTNLVKIIKSKSSKILQYDYEEDEIIYSKENRKDIDLALSENKSIYYVNITPNIEEYNNILISIKKSNEINIKTNIPLILIELLEYLLGDI